MNKKNSVIIVLMHLMMVNFAFAQEELVLENDYYKIAVEKENGAIVSFYVKANQSELIGEKRLINNFRILLPLPDYNANYIEGMEQKPESVTKNGNIIEARFNGMSSEKGKFPIELYYSISLVDDYVSFTSKIKNNSNEPVAEFWFPHIGGWTQFGNNRDAKLAIPKYNISSEHNISLFKNYPGGRGLGAEAAEFSSIYPHMVMPWWDIYDSESETGMYMAYHDTTFRLSTWHTYLFPNNTGDRKDSWFTEKETDGEPIGLVFSHVRYPYIKSGETLESGEFIIRAHKGDWHNGSMFYRDWFMANFPFDNSDSWLRKKSAWFTSIIYQPEDNIIANYETYDKWTSDAQKYGINTFELIGWDSGGLERDYPIYRPEEKLGGRKGFQKLMNTIKAKGGKSLVFNNYNILDPNTEWYKKELYKYRQHNSFGTQKIWMGWGESTLLARSQLDVRFHVRSSITPEIEQILINEFKEIVKDGADAFQMDKVCVAGGELDFNPLNKLKPDVALHQGLVDAIERVNNEMIAINPDFQMAAEFGYDRLLPFFDIGYRNATGYEISTLRYVFPEWTACQHISLPRDFRSVNAAVLNGAVIVIEPDSYQGSIEQPLYKELATYIKEVEKIRSELANTIFLGKYYDELYANIFEVKNNVETENQTEGITLAGPGDMPGVGAKQTSVKSESLHYRVYGEKESDKRAIIVVNDSDEPVTYVWEFLHKDVSIAKLYEPFKKVKTIDIKEAVVIPARGLHILME